MEGEQEQEEGQRSADNEGGSSEGAPVDKRRSSGSMGRAAMGALPSFQRSAGAAVGTARPKLPPMVLPGAVFHLFRPPDSAANATNDDDDDDDEEDDDDDEQISKKKAKKKKSNKKKKKPAYTVRRVADQGIFQGVIRLGHGRPIGDHNMLRYEKAIKAAQRNLLLAQSSLSSSSTPGVLPPRPQLPASFDC